MIVLGWLDLVKEIMKKALVPGILVVLVALASLPSIASSFPEEPAASSIYLQAYTLPASLTHVYNMLEYSLPANTIPQIIDAQFIGQTILAVGPSTYALMSVNPIDRSLSIEASGAIVGTGKGVFVSSTIGSSWYGVYTDHGEILLINSTDYSYLVSYYTATRQPVVSASLYDGLNSTKLVALDQEGYAYIHTVPQPYVLEIGPSSHDTALASLPYFTLFAESQVKQFVSGTNWVNTNLSMLPVASYTYTGNMETTLYYWNSSSASYEPVIPGSSVSGGNITVKKLYLYLVDYNNLSVKSLTIESSVTNTFLFSNLPPGTREIFPVFEITVKNATTNTIISQQCYTSGRVPVTVVPGSTLSLTLNLDPAGSSLSNCLQLYNVTVLQDSIYLPILVVNLDTVNSTNLYDVPDYGAPLWMTILPISGDVGPDTINFIEAYKVTSKPAGWPANASGILVVGANRYVYVYLVDDNLVPQEFNTANKYYEVLDVGTTPTTIQVYGDGSTIYVGTSYGTIYQYAWNSTYQKYLETYSYQLDTRQVVSLKLSEDGTRLIASSKGGLLQLIDTANWTPLWRGIPGYTGVETSMDSPILLGDPSRTLIIYSTESYALSAMYNISTQLVPVRISLDLRLRDLNGTLSSLQIPEGTNATIYYNGSPVAYSSLGSNTTFYLPPGSYTVNITIPGIGSLQKSYNVPYPGIQDTITVTLRQVDIYAYTPQSIGDPQRDPGYYLMSGPKPGTNIQLSQIAFDPLLGYTPSTPIVTSVTDETGHTIVVVWEGVSYLLTGSLQDYTISPVTVSYYGSQHVNVIANPTLVPSLIEVVDSDSLGTSTPYYIDGAQAILYYTVTGRTVTLSIGPGPSLYYLPEGNYLVNVTAQHYIPTTTYLTVTSPTASLNVSLSPEIYLLQQKVYSQDPTSLGIANGPIGGATVSITMTWPIPGLVNLVVYTGPNGEIDIPLRYGTYQVTVNYTYADPVTYTLVLGSDTAKTTTLTLYESSIVYTIHDAEYTVYRVQNVTLSVTYVGSNYQNTVNITVPSGQTIVTLPQGQYIIKASAKYYNTLTINRVYSSSHISELLYLQPKYVQVTIHVEYSPSQGNLAEGPIQGAEVQAEIKYPAFPIPPVTTYTNAQGDAVILLREGIYNITVRNQYTTSLVFTYEIVGNSVVPVQLYPLYSNITLEILDSETQIPIPGVNVKISKITPGNANTAEYILENGSLTITLPAGEYLVQAEYIGRYYTQQATIILLPGSNNSKTLSLSPIYETLTITTNVSQAMLVINGQSYQLPETRISQVQLAIYPDDPLLKTVYNQTMIVYTGRTGEITLMLRTGIYQVTAVKPGYITKILSMNVTTQSQTQIIKLVPKTNNVTLRVLDNELVNPVLSGYNITISSYNDVPVNIAITNIQDILQIQAPTGIYQITVGKLLYHNQTIQTYIQNNTELTVELAPITRNILVTINVQAQNIGGQVTNATLVLKSTTWNLADPYINTSITTGTATLQSIRLGQYQVWLVNEYYGINLSLGNITVNETTIGITLIAEPQTSNVTISLYDSDLTEPIIGNAVLRFNYQGPLGQGVITVAVVNGTGQVELPKGEYSVEITSDYYKDYSSQFTVAGDTQYFALLLPVRVNTVLDLLDIDGNPVTISGIPVVFIHSATGEVTQGEVIEGKIVPYRGLRLGTYEVIIQPPEDSYIDTTTTHIIISASGSSPDKIVANPKFYDLTILVYDPVRNGPTTQEVTITVTRAGTGGEKYGLPLVTNVTNGTITLNLPYGLYTISVDTGPNSYFQNPNPVSISLMADQTLKINLIPKQYQVTVYVIDDRGNPVQDALVEVYRAGTLVASLKTDATGQIVFSGYYGGYQIMVTADGYKPAQVAINVPTQQSVTIPIEPGPKVIVKRYLPLTIGMLGIIIIASIFYVARSKIMSRLAEEEEYF